MAPRQSTFNGGVIAKLTTKATANANPFFRRGEKQTGCRQGKNNDLGIITNRNHLACRDYYYFGTYIFHEQGEDIYGRNDSPEFKVEKEARDFQVFKKF